MSARLILGIDTTGRRGSAALATASGIVESFEWRATPSHTIDLQSASAKLVEQAGGRLVAVAVAAGPGGFSSVRTGMAFAKGLCLALDLQLAAIESLDAVAASVPLTEPRRVVAALDAGRSGYFAREFEVDGAVVKRVGEAAVVSAVDLVEMIAAGALLAGDFDNARRSEIEALAGDDGSVEFAPAGRPLAEAVAMAGWSKLGELSGGEVHAAVPTYMRAPGATLPRKGWGRA